jgi:hypothetical protein
MCGRAAGFPGRKSGTLGGGPRTPGPASGPTADPPRRTADGRTAAGARRSSVPRRGHLIDRCLRRGIRGYDPGLRRDALDPHWCARTEGWPSRTGCSPGGPSSPGPGCSSSHCRRRRWMVIQSSWASRAGATSCSSSITPVPLSRVGGRVERDCPAARSGRRRAARSGAPLGVNCRGRCSGATAACWERSERQYISRSNTSLRTRWWPSCETTSVVPAWSCITWSAQARWTNTTGWGRYAGPHP